MQVDVCFPVKGETLPTDHCYLLYSALSRVVPAFHNGTVRLRFSTVNGERGGKGLIQLLQRSRLRVRLPVDQIGLVLPLAGRPLQVGDHSIRLGIPTVAPLSPAPTLRAKVVTYKHAMDVFLAVLHAEEPGLPAGNRTGRRMHLRDG